MVDFRFLRHLWSFLAIAEERHFGRAAKRLGISQPPLSQQIQILEQALGFKLFVRSRRGAELTPEGAAILPAVRRFAEQAGQMEAAVSEARLGRSEVIHVGAITSAIVDILPAVFRITRERHPHVTLTLAETDSSAAMDALLNGDIDVAFARFDHDVDPIKVRRLANDRLVVALPVGHPLAVRRKIKLASLAGHAMVLFPRRITPAYYDSIIAACRVVGFSPNIVQEVSTVPSQVAFVSCGLGIALVPGGLARLGAEGVVFRPLAEKVDVVTTAVAWNDERASPRVRDLVKIAVEHAAGRGPPI
jgi:DNA-binding transcriptional LysR family regulator